LDLGIDAVKTTKKKKHNQSYPLWLCFLIGNLRIYRL
jgi:hypothetical protein